MPKATTDMQIFLTLSGHDKANIKRVSLSRDTLIGRSAACPLRIASKTVSRKHCEIHIGEETATVVDLGSSNGTFVGSERLPKGEERELPEGVRLNVGGIRFLVSYQAASLSHEGESAPATEQPTAALSPVAPPEEEVDEDVLPLDEEDHLTTLGTEMGLGAETGLGTGPSDSDVAIEQTEEAELDSLLVPEPSDSALPTLDLESDSPLPSLEPESSLELEEGDDSEVAATLGEPEEIFASLDEDEPILVDEGDAILDHVGPPESAILPADSATDAAEPLDFDAAEPDKADDKQEPVEQEPNLQQQEMQQREAQQHVEDEEDAILPVDDEDEAFSFLDDDDDDNAATSNSSARDAKLGDFLNHLGRE